MGHGNGASEKNCKLGKIISIIIKNLPHKMAKTTFFYYSKQGMSVMGNVNIIVNIQYITYFARVLSH